jgi:hypothetical protein
MERKGRGKRRSLRRAVALECGVRSDLWDGELRLPIANLSTDGLWLETRLALSPGHELIVSFEPPLAQRSEVIWAAAEVVRAGVYRPSAESPAKRGVGLAIRYCSIEHKRLLARSLLGCPPRLPSRVGRPPPLPNSSSNTE